MPYTDDDVSFRSAVIEGDLEVHGQIIGDLGDVGTPNEETLSGAKVLTDEDETIQILNGGLSNRNVTLPVISAGKTFWVVNSGASNKLVIKSSAAATLATIGVGQAAIIVGGAATWRILIVYISSAELTATIANLNAVPTATGTGAEIDAQTKDVMSSASTWVLSASLATQTATFQAKDADGNNIAAVQRVRIYLATLATGSVLAAAAFAAVAPTTGTILKAHTAKLDWDFLTDSNGVLVLSINNTGGSDHYAVFAIAILPNGKIKASLVTDVRNS